MNYSKDGVTVTDILDTRRPKSSGLYPVRIRVTYARQRQYYPTGKDLTEEEWEKLPTTKVQALIDIRKDIDSSFHIIRGIVSELTSTTGFSFDALNMRLKAGVSDTLNTAFKAKINLLINNGQIGTAEIYKTALLNIEHFAGNRISFTSITPDWLRRFDRFLKSEDKSQTSIGIYMRHLRAIINEAKRAGVIKEAQYPFGRGRYEIQAGSGRKFALNLEQIGTIARYDDGTELTAIYRDYWLFLYLCNGINVADFVKLRYKDIEGNEIFFVRQKTERTSQTIKEIRVTITKPMWDIINKWGNSDKTSYIFPILDGTEKPIDLKTKTRNLTRAINQRMAKIGEVLGIPHTSTYVARHSYATISERSGASLAYISESLGHNNIKTTEHYLASFEQEERAKNAELLTKF